MILMPLTFRGLINGRIKLENVSTKLLGRWLGVIVRQIDTFGFWYVKSFNDIIEDDDS